MKSPLCALIALALITSATASAMSPPYMRVFTCETKTRIQGMNSFEAFLLGETGDQAILMMEEKAGDPVGAKVGIPIKLTRDNEKVTLTSEMPLAPIEIVIAADISNKPGTKFDAIYKIDNKSIVLRCALCKTM